MATGKKKILIVDDEKDIVTYLDTLLRDNGYATVTACDGDEGLTKLREEKPDLVTLDISMPKTSGTRMYRELKTNSELKGIPVIIITAITGADGDPYAYHKFISSRGAVPPPEGFFPKPIVKEDLLAALAKLLP